MELRRDDVEARLKIPVAYQKMIDLLTKLSSNLNELLKIINQTIYNFDNMNIDELNTQINSCREIKKNIEIIKNELIDYISKAAPALLAKEEWIRLLSKLSGLSDKAIGIMYRIEQLLLNHWHIPPKVRSSLVKLVLEILKMLDECKLALSLIGINANRTLSACSQIERIEKGVDELYRRAIFLIIRCECSFQEVLLLRDIAEMLEEMADTLESTVDDIRIILMNLL